MVTVAVAAILSVILSWDSHPGDMTSDSAGDKRSGIHMVIYPLVNIQKAIENGHRNSGFTH